MHAAGPKNPLHGITLEMMVVQLHAYYGWEGLEERIRVNCFACNPSVKSSLKFLRKTPWARQKVEDLYLFTLPRLQPATEQSGVDAAEDTGLNAADETPENLSERS